MADLRDEIRRTVTPRVVPFGDGYLAVMTNAGWVFFPATEFRSVLHFAEGAGGHEPGTTDAIQRLTRQGDVVVDVGAHVGLLTLSMAHAVGPSGRVYAVEPHPISVDCLRRTTLCSGFDQRVVIAQAALADKDGIARLYLGSNNMLSSLYKEVDGQSSIEVKTLCLDTLVPDGTKVSLIKIDVEGAELDVFAGMSRVIGDSSGLVLIVECGPSFIRRGGLTVAEWLERFAAKGYSEVVAIDETNGSFRKVCHGSEIENLYSVNLAMFADAEQRSLLLPN